MRKAKRTILIAMLILAGFVPVCLAGSDKPLSGGESGGEILKYLQDFDSVYRSGFTISGTYRRDSLEKKWKITTSNEKIAYEEEVINILKLPDEAKGRWLPLRRTWLITPKLQAEHSFVGRVYEVGKLPPWPENSPGPTTSGKLDIDDPDAPSYIFPIKKALWSLGRGYSEHITQITNVTQRENGLLSVTAEGTDAANRPGAKWELLIDPDAAYMVREAKLYKVGENKPFVSVVNSGTKWVGSRCVPEQTQLKEPFATRATEHLSETVSNSTDEAFLRYVELAIRKPYLVHTDIVDHRMSPKLRLSYNAGSLFPTGRKGQEQKIVFEPLEQASPVALEEKGPEQNDKPQDVTSKQTEDIISTKEKYPTAFELLDKYAETQDKLKSFILKSEDEFTAEYDLRFVPNRSGRRKGAGGYLGEVRSDGTRHYRSEKLWEKRRAHVPATKSAAQSDPRYKSYLWDGKRVFQYQRSNKTAANDRLFLTPEAHEEARGEHIISTNRSRVLLGYFADTFDRAPYNFRRIDNELKQAAQLEVLQATEPVRGSQCYVIVAQTAESRYKLRIDPQHSFHIARAEITRGGRGVKFGNREEISLHTYLKNVRFQKFGNVWMPVEADWGYQKKFINNCFSRADYHHEIVEFTLSPDHKLLHSFETDEIRNGTNTHLIGVPGILYTWQDGKVVDKDGREVDVDKLIKAESEKVKKPKPKGK